jgi:NADH-dependent peroxiredoxin subunit C
MEKKRSQKSTYCEYCGDFHDSLHEFVSQIAVGETVPDYEFEALHKDQVVTAKLSDYRGSWLVAMFYPAGFSPDGEAELTAMIGAYPELNKNGAEVISFSTDTVFTHIAWRAATEALRSVPFPMGADPSGKIALAFGVLVEGGELPYTREEGLALSSTFIVDPKGTLRAMEVHDAGIGRSAEEVLRKLKAAQVADSSN